MLYYIHGYQSSPQGEKAILLKKTIQAIPITYRDGNAEDLIISHCLKRIGTVIQDDSHVILIGSSLGGFLAASTALTHSNVKQLILLNPAIVPLNIDLNTIESMPLRILEDMREQRFFTEKITASITIIRGIQDDVVPYQWILSFAKAQKATIKFYDDDHRFSKNLKNLPRIIAELLQ